MSTRQLQKWACPRRILLATDLVDLGFILPVAIQQALAYKAELRIAHVLPDSNISPIGTVPEVSCAPDWTYKHAKAKLEKAVATAAGSAVRCSAYVAAGNVVTEIMKIVVDWKADRLVTGSQGKEKSHLHILGSVAESIFHRVEVPVLAIGPHAVSKKRVLKDRMRIVFATPLDHDSRRMAEFALNVAENHHADISLLHVSPEIARGHPSAARVTEYASKMLQDLLNVRTIDRCRPVCEVVYGQPAESILEYAQQHSADMIVLGASAHSAFDSRFIPGIAYRVLCGSPCPVLVLKQGSAWISAPQEAVRLHSARHE
ncbi:MAG: universal stress protein [Acidobacteriaceae bacterium]